MTRVVQVPERFVAGESGALINAINGRAPLPPGRKVRASDSGVDRRPTLLSNAETFAQLAVLAMLGPEGYAGAGTSAEPGTVLLTVGGAAGRPAVVEVPAGHRLGEVLDLCEVPLAQGVLVGGYHGCWLPAEVAYDVPVSRAGLTRPAGRWVPESCWPSARTAARSARWRGSRRTWPRSRPGSAAPAGWGCPASRARWPPWRTDRRGPRRWTRLAAASPRSAGGVRARTPTGSPVRDVGDRRLLRRPRDAPVPRQCGRPVTGTLPLPSPEGEKQLTINWTRCPGTSSAPTSCLSSCS